MDCDKENYDQRRAKHPSILKRQPYKDPHPSPLDSEMQAGEIKNSSSKKSRHNPRSPTPSPSPHQRSKSRSRTRKSYTKPATHSSEESTSHFHRRRSPSFQKYPPATTRLEGEKIEVKLVLPRRLVNDQKELRYIEEISRCTIWASDEVRGGVIQRLESGEGMIYVRGSLRENNECVRLILKRLGKYERK